MKNQIITKLKEKWLKAKTWIKEHKKEFLLLCLVLLIGAFVRLYKINEYMTFLSDEGRDVIVVRKLLVDADPILLGPGTSIGDMYLGPIYYYIMAPALLLSNFSPVGPAVMIALLGVITIFFVWYIAKRWFPDKNQKEINYPALAFSLLYALSPTIIIYSRSSWNPNIMPFFALLVIYALWKIYQEINLKWLIVLGVSFAITLQSHYLALLLAPTIGIFLLLTLLKIRKQKEILKKFTIYSLITILFFVLIMSPLVIFDARHNWMNFSSIKKFFTYRETTVSIKPWKAIPNIWPLFEQISARLVAGRNELAGKITAFGLLLGTVFVAFKIWKKKRNLFSSPYFLLIVWLGSALIGLGVYKQHIYDHYFGFFFAAPFLLLVGLAQEAKESFKKVGIFLILGVFIALLGVNLADNPFRYHPNRQVQKAKTLAEKVIELTGGEKFNFAVIAKTNSEGGYEYFFQIKEHAPLHIDATNINETLADQLFVICELPKDECAPLSNNRPEITAFGPADVVASWEENGVIIYKLIHKKQ